MGFVPRSASMDSSLPIFVAAVSDILNVFVSAVKGICKNKISETAVFEQYGMICLALDEIVCEGVLEAGDWDTIRRGIKLKMSEV